MNAPLCGPLLGKGRVLASQRGKAKVPSESLSRSRFNSLVKLPGNLDRYIPEPNLAFLFHTWPDHPTDIASR